MDGYTLGWTSSAKAIKSNLHCLLSMTLLLDSYLQPGLLLPPPPHCTRPILTTTLDPLCGLC